MVSLIPASAQYRLSGIYLSISGSDNRLKVGSNEVLFASDSGNMGGGGGNAAQTGQILYNNITGLSGTLVNYAQTGTMLSFYSGISTGNDTVYFNFLNYTFPSIPRVNVTFELADVNNIVYYVAIADRSTTGFFAKFSDIISETGNGLNIWAKSD